MMRIFLLSIFVACGLSALNVQTDNLDPARLADEVFNQIDSVGNIGDLTAADASIVKSVIKNSVVTQLARVDTGELSLDPRTPNYFLLDTIKAGIDACPCLAR